LSASLSAGRHPARGLVCFVSRAAAEILRIRRRRLSGKRAQLDDDGSTSSLRIQSSREKEASEALNAISFRSSFVRPMGRAGLLAAKPKEGHLPDIND
jgi:hypothetical protein